MEERVLNRVPVEILALSFLAALVTFLIWDLVTALLLLAGGVLSTIGFIWLKKAVTKILTQHSRRKSLLPGLLLYLLRIALIIGIIFIIILNYKEKIIAFIVGFSMIFPVSLWEAVLTLSRIKKWKS